MPKKLRRQPGLSNGSRAKPESRSDSVHTAAGSHRAKAMLKGLGLSGYRGKTIPIEDMNSIVALAVRHTK